MAVPIPGEQNPKQFRILVLLQALGHQVGALWV